MYDFNPLSSCIEIKPKQAWKLLTWPYEANWAFNLYKYLIINEQFLKGTQECLDHWYFLKTGKTTKSHLSYQWAMFAKEEPEEYDTTWTYKGEDPEDPKAAYYIDSTTGHTLWLCPLWTAMWGEKPKKLFCSFEPCDD